FYDVLTYPDGRYEKFRVRSLVGIIPLYASEVIDEEELHAHPELKGNFMWFLKNRKNLTDQSIIPIQKTVKSGYLLTLVVELHLKSVFRYSWDANEFRVAFGLRSL